MSGVLASTFATIGGAGGGGGGGGGGGAIVSPMTLDGVSYADQGTAGSDPTSATVLTFYPNGDRKSTRLNSSHIPLSRMPSSA